MELLVGLGNPGREYAGTRHNMGFRAVDEVARRHGITLSGRRFQGRTGRGRVAGQDVLLLKPQTYMNLSGGAVRAALSTLGLLPRDMLVVVDDLDLPVGRLRLKGSGSSAGHRGLESIADHLRTTEFPRLRLGIGRPESGGDVVKWVLDRPSRAELAILDRVVVAAADCLEAFLAAGLERAMAVANGLDLAKPADSGPGDQEPPKPRKPQDRP
ncbi:MAG TPA: aminoacyl-tRNA hydrolase [Bacillota bacterium]|jgi:PTH1 family peptidyl-tRNA hydrolase